MVRSRSLHSRKYFAFDLTWNQAVISEECYLCDSRHSQGFEIRLTLMLERFKP